MKVDVKGNVNQPRNIDYRATFCGEALVVPVAINPTKEQKIKLHGLENIADKIKDPQYTDITLKDRDGYTKIEFHCMFDPNEQMKLNEQKYLKNIPVVYGIFIRPEYRVSKDGTKIQVIDSHLQSEWIPYDGKDAKSSLESYCEELKKKKDEDLQYNEKRILQVDPDTVRHAYEGEVALYDFLWHMTWYRPHSPNADPSKNFILNMTLSVPGDDSKSPSEAFVELCNGNFDIVRSVFKLDATRIKQTNGTTRPVKVGVFLGVRQYGTRNYQEVLTNPFTACVFKESAFPRDQTGLDGKVYKTRLSNDTLRIITNPQYPWRNDWYGMELTEYVGKQNAGADAALAFNTTVNVGFESEADDDMPF